MDTSSSRGSGAGDAPPAPTSQRAPPIRSRFTTMDDVILLRAVNDFRPWRAPVGTALGVMKVFEEIAEQCAKDQKFVRQKGGPALRTRFVTLLNQFQSDRCKSMRQAGTVAECEEREKLLEDISSQIDNWNKQSNKGTDARESRMQALLRLEKEMKRPPNSESAHDEEEEKETEGEEDANSATSDHSDLLSGGSENHDRVSKRQRVDSVADALVSVIASMRDVEKRKIDFEIQKLNSDREQAERQRQHEREESARRREHELALQERWMASEQRRFEAEEARERRMHDFILKLLDQQKKSN